MILEQKIIDTIRSRITALQEAPQLNNVGNREWTHVIKSELSYGGRTLGYKVAASGISDDIDDKYGEWLYDVTWLNYADDGKGSLRSVPLIAECEWGNDGDVDDDFEKLLLGRANVRLMIFGDANKSNVATTERLCRYIDSFSKTQDGDVYLFAMYENRKEWFRYFRIEAGKSAGYID